MFPESAQSHLYLYLEPSAEAEVGRPLQQGGLQVGRGHHIRPPTHQSADAGGGVGLAEMGYGYVGITALSG
jgi:hypothetical protein